MKRAILVIVAILLASLILPLVPQTADAVPSCTVVANAPSDMSYFWATLNGEVTAIAGVSTVYSGFVWATTSYGDPGNTEPWMTAYVSDPEGSMTYNSDVHSDPFSFALSGSDVGAYLKPSRTYYLRSCVYLDAPLNMWQYSNERSFEMGLNPEGTWCFYGWSAPSYCTVTTGAADPVGAGVAELHGSVAWSADLYAFDHPGFVYDTISHPNPSGWPGDWVDTAPASSGYADGIEVTSSGVWGNVAFYGLVLGLDPGETYYYRAVADRQSGGDWVYGEELSFTVPGDCVLQNYKYAYPDYEGDIWLQVDPISIDIWAGQNIVTEIGESYTASAISLKMYRSGTVSTVNVAIYLADDYSWYPVGLPLATGFEDVSSLTTDNSGEWVTVQWNASVDFTYPNVYDVVVSSDGVFEYPDHMNCLVWVTTEYAGFSDYMNTYDDGSNWSWPMRDGLYILWCCPATSVANLYETWGYVPSTKPAWYQAWPSILKVLYIACVLISALFMYRRQPKKPEYPDMMGPEV